MLPDNLNTWEKALAIGVQVLMYGGGALLCALIWRRMKRAFLEGLEDDKKGKRQ